MDPRMLSIHCHCHIFVHTTFVPGNEEVSLHQRALCSVSVHHLYFSLTIAIHVDVLAMLRRSLFGFADLGLEARYRESLKTQIKPWLLIASFGPLINLIAITSDSLRYSDVIYVAISGLAWTASMLCLAYSRIQKGHVAVGIVLGYYSALRIVTAFSSNVHITERLLSLVDSKSMHCLPYTAVHTECSPCCLF